MIFSCNNPKNDRTSLLLSPDNSKEIEFHTTNGQEDITRITINERNGKSRNAINIFSISCNKNEIELFWIRNKTITIEFPIEKEIQLQKTDVKILDELIQIEYNPFKYAKIINHETIISNQNETKISVQISEEFYNSSVMLVNERYERLSLPRDKENQYKYGNVLVEPGKYRLLLHTFQENHYSHFFEIPNSKTSIIKLE